MAHRIVVTTRDGVVHTVKPEHFADGNVANWMRKMDISIQKDELIVCYPTSVIGKAMYVRGSSVLYFELCEVE